MSVIRRVALGNREVTVSQGGVCAENVKTDADMEKAGQKMLTVLQADTALTRTPCSVKSLVYERLGNKHFPDIPWLHI